MSRIHEALKKAASERNAQLPADSASELVELAGENVAEREISPPVRGAGRNGSGGTGKALSPHYEELLRKCQRTEWKIDPRFSVFVNETRDRSGAEKFRTLRSRLYQIAATRPLKRILVTSSVPEEGKTFIASNLAQSIIRQEHRRVLLIDGDLRASRLHLTLGASATPGLTEYLRGEADEFKIIQTGQQSNLSLIAGGTDVPNPSELLHSNVMRTLLDRLTPLFDWVILDSPPAIAVHDASILADMCDGVLFVVRAGMTDFEVAQKAAGEFDEKRLLGVIMNRVDKSAGYPYYYAYSKEQEES
jgi:capsular exopolysaccharide synthesis family protein